MAIRWVNGAPEEYEPEQTVVEPEAPEVEIDPNLIDHVPGSSQTEEIE